MPFSAAEGGEKTKTKKKKKKKVGNPNGDPVRGRDAPIKGCKIEGPPYYAYHAYVQPLSMFCMQLFASCSQKILIEHDVREHVTTRKLQTAEEGLKYRVENP